MSKLRNIQPPARYRGELFNRDLNAQLARSRASGSSAIRRLPVAIAAARARMADPKALIAYVPPIPKGLLTAGRFRRRRTEPGRPFKFAEPDVLLRDHTGKVRYCRLTNGQIVRATVGDGYAAVRAGHGVIRDFSRTALNPASISQLPKQDLPRHER